MRDFFLVSYREEIELTLTVEGAQQEMKFVA